MNTKEIKFKGYDDRSILLNNGIYPTARQDDSFDIHLYAWIAAVALDINELERDVWIQAYKQGWMQREEDYLVTENGTILQRWGYANPRFGVATSIPEIIEKLLKMGAVKEPAHYGRTGLLEHFKEDSYLLPISLWQEVEALLFFNTKN